MRFAVLSVAIALVFSFGFFAFCFFHNLKNRAWKWVTFQTLGFVLNLALLLPALYLAFVVLRIAGVKNRLEPSTSDVAKIEGQIKSACANAISKFCSKKDNDLHDLVLCLGQQRQAYQPSSECFRVMGIDIKFPALKAPRQFGNAILPIGASISRSRGRMILADVPSSWDFNGVHCQKGVVHFASTNEQSDDSKTYLMNCELDGDQLVDGVWFRGGGNFSTLVAPKLATFFYPSGRISQGVLLKDTVIKEVPVSGNGGWTHFFADGRVSEGVASSDFELGRFKIKKGQNFTFSDQPSSEHYPGIYSCLTEMAQFQLSKRQLENLCAHFPDIPAFQKFEYCLPGALHRQTGKSYSWVSIYAAEAKEIKSAIDNCSGFDIDQIK